MKIQLMDYLLIMLSHRKMEIEVIVRGLALLMIEVWELWLSRGKF